MPAKKTTKQVAKQAAKQHEHILMPAKLNPWYLCCVRKGCRYTEYRPAKEGRRRRVLSQSEESQGVARRVEPAIIVTPVSLWQWAETQAEASAS